MRDIFYVTVLLYCGGLNLARSRMTTRELRHCVESFSAEGFSKTVKLRFLYGLRYQGLYCLRIKDSIRR